MLIRPRPPNVKESKRKWPLPKVKSTFTLLKQIALMEIKIKCLKEREIEQKNKASSYETLLKDGIPLNEHFLALKTKYNTDKAKLE